MTATAATTDSILPIAEPRFRVNRNREKLPIDTSMDPTQSETSWTARGSTIGTVAPANTTPASVNIHSTIPIVTAYQARTNRQDYVDGAISEKTGDGLVKCTVRVDGRDVSITLPEDCFDMPIEYGRPFRLTMVQHKGFKAPRITSIPVSALNAADQDLYDEIMMDNS